MAEKIIIDIEVKGEEWERFNKLYDAYTKKLKDSQNVWDGTSNKVNEAAKDAGVLESTFNRINVSADKFSNKIANITKDFLKWGAIFMILKGLTGTGGKLFGLDKLAADAAATRRVAQGLGMDYGSMQSFKYNFQRIVDTQALMSNVSSAKYDVTSGARLGLMSLGLGGEEEMKKDTGEISADVVKKIPELLKGVRPEMWIPTAKAMHILDLVSEEDVIRAMTMSPEEIKYADQQREARKKELTLSEEQSKAWSDLNTQLIITGEVIKTTFQKALAGLAPELTQLSHALEVAADWMGDKLVEWLKPLGSALKQMTDEDIKDKLNEWFEGVKGFFSDMDKMFVKIKEIAGWFSWLSGAVSGALNFLKPGEAGAFGQKYSNLNTSGQLPGDFDTSNVGAGGNASVGARARGARSAHEASDASGVGGAAPKMTASTKQVASDVAEAFRKAGATEEGIAGMFANISDESRFNAANRHFDQPAYAGTEAGNAHGLWQMGGAEWNRYAAWINKNHPGANWADHKLQTEYQIENLKKNYPEVWGKMTTHAPASEQAKTFVAGYERPSRGNLAARQSKYGRGVAPVGSYTGGASSMSLPDAGTKRVLDRTTKAPGAQDESSEFDAARGIRKSKKASPQASNMSHFQGATRQMAINLYSQPGSNTIISASQVGGNAHA